MSVLAPARTVRELEMMRMSASIRAKPEWYRKYQDAEIVARWSREAAEQGMTQAQIRYVLDELEYYDDLRDAERGIEVSAVDGVWQSDSLIDEDLRKRLAEAVRVLEDVPSTELDWHPGSDEQVLDLVHPSMYCLVRGVSVPEDAPWPVLDKKDERASLSKHFQWLPTDVEVGDDGSVAFLSYVNNVDPERHQELAAVLPEIFGATLPLLENVLTDLRAPKRVRIEADPFSWYGDTEPQPPEDDDDDAAEEAYEEAMEKWWEERRPTIPDAPEFERPERDATRAVTLGGRRLQVIVKLANIHLTPDKPDYYGGSWHVEAMLNERIVATAIYYWDSDNITESLLGFRTAIDEPEYEQNDNNGVSDVYGLDDEDPLNQELGSVRTTTGRCVAFPNIYQHRVAPFRLDDPTREGHRKIVAFFLVDPSVTITSTADVPPQQPWSPTSTMTRAQAEGFREQLMHERKFFVDEHNEEYFEREFYLCEH
nr:DUF4246 domain-containing protein [Nocardia caishijiensis]